jgi:RimJ/RimL family protein N-acetyltransferase
MRNKTSLQPVAFLRGRRIILRPPLATDLPYIIRWINDPDVWQYLSIQTPQSEKGEKEWIEKQNTSPSNITLIIETKTGIPIGVMGLHKINPIDGTATTGAMIGNKRFWNKGYGSEAKKLLLSYAFDILNLRMILSDVIGFNGRSVRYSEKCGYKVVARIPDMFYRFGKYHDKIILAVTKDGFEKFRKKRS